jgi:hypothetical protein
MTKQLIALLRMRERQMGIQQQTRLLDENKGEAENYRQRSEKLASGQQKLNEDFVELKDQNHVAVLARPFAETHLSLQDVQKMLSQPKTDNEAVELETRTIDLMTDLINLINEQAQRNPPPSGSKSQPSAEDMAFLMKMMSQKPQVEKGMPMKSPGGGNTMGGTTDQASGRATGNSTGRGGIEKTVQKASGAGNNSLPTEFREQLEDYFKALEQEPD